MRSIQCKWNNEENVKKRSSAIQQQKNNPEEWDRAGKKWKLVIRKHLFSCIPYVHWASEIYSISSHPTVWTHTAYSNWFEFSIEMPYSVFLFGHTPKYEREMKKTRNKSEQLNFVFFFSLFSWLISSSFRKNNTKANKIWHTHTHIHGIEVKYVHYSSIPSSWNDLFKPHPRRIHIINANDFFYLLRTFRR